MDELANRPSLICIMLVLVDCGNIRLVLHVMCVFVCMSEYDVGVLWLCAWMERVGYWCTV